MLIFGRVIAAIFGLVMLINASFMLVSPRAWFRLPGWLRAQGTMTEEKYTKGWGALQVHIAGALMISVLVWVIYDMFFGSHVPS
jgi:hypothetical protein